MARRDAWRDLIRRTSLDPRFLEVCLAARALWLHLVDRASLFEEPGVLMSGGAPLSMRALAFMAAISIEDATDHVEALLSQGLVSRRSDGALVVPTVEQASPPASRRGIGGRPRRGETANDQSYRERQTSLRLMGVIEGGLAEGAVPIGAVPLPEGVVDASPSKTRPETPGETPGETPAETPGETPSRAAAAALLFSSEKESKQQQQQQADSGEDAGRAREAVTDLTARASRAGRLEPSPAGEAHVRSWLAEGASDELVLSVVRSVAARPNYVPPGHLGYFTAPIRAEIARRPPRRPEAAQRPPPDPAEQQALEWFEQARNRWTNGGCRGVAPKLADFQARARAAAAAPTSGATAQ